MRVNGIVDSEKGPRIQVRVTISSSQVSDLFWFLVDTGATYTQISEGDFLKLGISRNQLKETTEEIFIAGDVLHQYVLDENVRLSFAGKNFDFEPMRALIYQSNDPEKRKRFLENVLSIIGRDLIPKFKITLTGSRIIFDG